MSLLLAAGCSLTLDADKKACSKDGDCGAPYVCAAGLCKRKSCEDDAQCRCRCGYCQPSASIHGNPFGRSRRGVKSVFQGIRLYRGLLRPLPVDGSRAALSTGAPNRGCRADFVQVARAAEAERIAFFCE